MNESRDVPHRAQFTAQATVTALGEFEVVGINAGTANGWNFAAQPLKDSLALWDGASCFVDHLGFFDDHHSVRDLGGVFHQPEWDDQVKGVKLKLTTCGPSGPLVNELGREMLAEGDGPNRPPKPKIGFSADIGFTATGRDVKQILRVYSLDLVFDPARGGAFKRALNSILSTREGHVSGSSQVQIPSKRAGPVQQAAAVDSTAAPGGTMSQAAEAVQPNATPPNPDVDALRTLLQVQEEQQRLAGEAEKAKAARVQMCGYLLESGLAASKLPAPAQEAIRAQFANRVFEPGELTAAVEGMRAMVSQLTGGAAIAGPAAVRSMFTSHDQIQAAVYDLFDVPREKGTEALHVHKLSGVRELYHGLTGDFDFYGGVFLDRAQFQHTTATFTGLVKNAMNKALIDRWEQLGRAGYDWWKKIAHVEHFTDLKQITWMIFGTVASLPSVAEGAEYSELQIGDSPETSNFTKYGGYIGVTLESLINDDTRRLKAIPRELANAGIRNISALVANLFSQSSYTGPTLADTGALFNSTAVTTKGGHANLTSTALGTDYSAWNVTALGIYKQPMLVRNDTGFYGAGKPMALWPSVCLVCPTLKAAADALFIPRWASNDWNAAGIPNVGGQTWGGRVEPVVVPDWTSTTAWFGVVSPALVPGVCIGEAFGLMPEIFVAGDDLSPAVFMNDESRLKVRHWIAVGVADFRPLSRGNA